MLFEAIPLLFFYLFTSVLFRSKVLNCCHIFRAAASIPLHGVSSACFSPHGGSGPPLFSGKQLLHLPHPPVLLSLRQKLCRPPTFSSGFFLSSYRVPDMLQDTDNSAVLRKTSGSSSAASDGTSCRQHLSPASPPSPLPLSQTSVIRTSYTPGTAV